MLYPTAHSPSPHRVVVTGAGVITALGRGWKANAAGFRAGQVAGRPIRAFDASRQRVRVAAEVDLPFENRGMDGLSARQMARLDRSNQMLLCAAQEALEQSGWQLPSSELPFVLGTTAGGMPWGEAYYRQATQFPQRHVQQATRALQYQSHTQARMVANALQFSGPICILSNACASGASAIGQAWEWVRTGRFPRALAAGYDSLCQFVFAGFDSLQALSPTWCRPFDRGRDGLSLGEGAAALALETWESARQRGATILGELAGFGASIDLHHLTQPQPDGDAAFVAMNQACATAQVRPDQVEYLNAHGTGTVLNDGSEARAIERWAGAHVARLAVSSTKGSIGHLLGGSGAVEAVVCLMVLREQWLPPEITLEEPDPACRFRLVRVPEEARLQFALSNSFGFGGVNATLLFRRTP